MRLKKKLCAIGLSCMLGVLCCVPASAAENAVSGGEMCGVCGLGNFVETDYKETKEEWVMCSVCKNQSIMIHYSKHIHYFQCDYTPCGYKNDYSDRDFVIEYADPCPYCILLMSGR